MCVNLSPWGVDLDPWGVDLGPRGVALEVFTWASGFVDLGPWGVFVRLVRVAFVRLVRVAGKSTDRFLLGLSCSDATGRPFELRKPSAPLRYQVTPKSSPSHHPLRPI